ncbi:hypothetical protein [Actinocrispum wychmicini]|nr:hypothetical protein [Actinocrispum wychmicini]
MRIPVAVALAAGLLAGFAPGANAADPVTAYCGQTKNSSGQRHSCGRTEFNSGGAIESFRVRDDWADGHSTVAFWHNEYNGDFGTVWNTSGFGSYTTEYTDFPEGTRIAFKTCAGESGSGLILENTCGSWQWVTA